MANRAGSGDEDDINGAARKGRVLRAAARELTPVVLDAGPGQPRLASYLTEVDGRGPGASLRLEPIATDVRIDGASRVVIRSAAPERPFGLIASGVELIPPDRARVPLARARLFALPARQCPRRVVDVRQPLMLLVLGDAEGSDIQTHPIVDIGQDGAAVETTVPLLPGIRLDPVEIVGDRRILRRAAAVVQEALPWRTPTGDRRFRCRLALGPSEADPSAGVYDLVSDGARVRRFMGLLGLMRSEGWLHCPGRPHASFRVLGASDASLLLELRSLEETPCGRVRIGVDLFATSYEMEVRVIRREGSCVEVTFPLVLRRRRRRRERRVDAAGAEAVALGFVNPLARERVVRVVTDLSYQGLCFLGESDDDVLWTDLPLEEASLRWRDREAHLGEIVVKSVERDPGGEMRAHCAIPNAAVTEDPDLIEILATLAHPALRVDDGSDFRGKLETYERCHVIHPYMLPGLERVLPVAARNWRSLHQRGRTVARTLYHEVDGREDATISVIRAWEHAWLVQHFGAAGPEGFHWSGELQMAAMDYLVPRPDGRFVFFFVDARNRSMNAFYERFFDMTGTPEAIERSAVDLWGTGERLPGDPGRRAGCSRVQPIRNRDGVMLVRAGERAFGPMTASALSILPWELRLPDTRRRFRAAGLRRERVGHILSDGRRPLIALLREDVSDGINLAGMMKATWLFPIHQEDDRDGEARRRAVYEVASRPVAHSEDQRYALAPVGFCEEEFTEAGFSLLMRAKTYVLNRAGLHRYYTYVEDRYGALGARAAQRSERRAG